MDENLISVRIYGARGLALAVRNDVNDNSLVDKRRIPFSVFFKTSQDSGNGSDSIYHGTFIQSSSDQWQVEGDNYLALEFDLDVAPQGDVEVGIRLQLGNDAVGGTIPVTFDPTCEQEGDKTWKKIIDDQGGLQQGEVLLSTKLLSQENKQGSLCKMKEMNTSFDYAHKEPGSLESIFHVIFEIRDIIDLSALDNIAEASFVWLSYEFLGNIIQTDLFSVTDSSSFPSREDEFQFKSTFEEAKVLLHDDSGLLNIYLCSERCIFGVAKVDVGSVFFPEDGSVAEGKQQITVEITPEKEDYDVLSSCNVASSSRPKLQLSLDLQIKPVGFSTEIRTNGIGFNNNFGNIHEENEFEFPPITAAFTHNSKIAKIGTPIKERLSSLASVDQIASAAKEISRAQADLVAKQKEWATFRRREEDKFRKHLRKKEDEVRKYLQEKIKKNEEEHTTILETSRRDYLTLESRLKKALAEVESKERQMKRKSDEKEALCEKKIAELELRVKIVREESEHLVEIETTKLQSALGKVKSLEKEIDGANSRAQKAEKALEALRQRQSETEEGQAQSEIIRLKHKLMEVESQLERERAAKDECIAEQEQYRLAAHKLAKLVRQERKKNNSTSCELQSNINTDSKSENELRRIKRELASLIDTS